MLELVSEGKRSLSIAITISAGCSNTVIRIDAVNKVRKMQIVLSMIKILKAIIRRKLKADVEYQTLFFLCV